MYEEWDTRKFSTEINPIRYFTLISLVSVVIIFLRYIIRNKLGRFSINMLKLNSEERESLKYKFRGSLFRLFYYKCSLIFEILILINQSWLFSPIQHTFDWPDNNVPWPFKLHHLIQFCYYLTSTWFLFVEPKLKDFYQMVTHHIITIFLIGTGYYYNLIRYGILIMIIHDSADPFLEFAKLNIYSHNIVLANITFVVFAIVFLSFRIIIFPCFIIAPALYYSFCYGNRVFEIIVLVLVALFIVNLFWAFYICKMATELTKKKPLTGDIREDKKTQ